VLTSLPTVLLALATGARHAFEPDHLAAVSTLVAGAPSRRAMVHQGLAWGIGHALAVGLASALLLPVRQLVPGRLDDALELAVACVLVALGVRSLLDAGRASVAHRHRGTPLAVGFAHGLAGSGALVATLAALEASPLVRAGYIVAFGLGATGAMAALSGFFGTGLARAMAVASVRRRVQLTAGAISSAVGLGWGFRALAALVG
jgi:hypothetical protein